jgi:hypothetical protein
VTLVAVTLVSVPVDAVHVTPWFRVPSPLTVAVNVCVAPPISGGVGGATLTLIGVSVTVAVPVLVVSVLLVAVIVAVPAASTTAGAVYTPPEVIAPVEAVHVTPALAVSFATVAVNVWLAPPINVAVSGLTATLIAGGPPPEQPARVKRERAVITAKTRGNRRDEITMLPYTTQNVCKTGPECGDSPCVVAHSMCC